MATKVRPCPKCKPHPYQDKTYGENRRVMNSTVMADKDMEGWRCTVCGEEFKVVKSSA